MRYRVGLMAGLVGLALSVAGSAEAQYPQVSTYCNSGGTWIPCTSSGGGGGGDVNLTQVDTETVDVGTGTAGAGTQRVAVASDSSITANAGTNLNTSALLTTAAFQTVFGTSSLVSADPCEGGTKVSVPISQATSTELFTGTASNRTYVCSVVILQPAASSQTYSLVSGTGTTCGTSTSALIGATSAANGMSVPFTAGNGGGTIAKTDTDADNVCLLQSSTDRINGVITYVVAP